MAISIILKVRVQRRFSIMRDCAFLNALYTMRKGYSADDLRVNPVSAGSADTPGINWMHACKAAQRQMGGIAPAHKIFPTLMS